MVGKAMPAATGREIAVSGGCPSTPNCRQNNDTRTRPRMQLLRWKLIL